MNREQLDADRRLWCAVIMQAIEDATSTSKSKHAARDRQRARTWLTTATPDLDDVCALGGFDAPAVRQRAMKLIEEADAGAIRVRTLTFQGETLTVRQWSERTGIPMNIIHNRIRAGMPAETVLSPGRLPSGTAALVQRRRAARDRGVGQNFAESLGDRRGVVRARDGLIGVLPV